MMKIVLMMLMSFNLFAEVDFRKANYYQAELFKNRSLEKCPQGYTKGLRNTANNTVELICKSKIDNSISSDYKWKFHLRDNDRKKSFSVLTLEKTPEGEKRYTYNKNFNLIRIQNVNRDTCYFRYEGKKVHVGVNGKGSGGVIDENKKQTCLDQRAALVARHVIDDELYACKSMELKSEGKVIICDGTQYRLGGTGPINFLKTIYSAVFEGNKDRTCPDSEMSIDGLSINCSNGNEYIRESNFNKSARSLKESNSFTRTIKKAPASQKVQQEK